MDEPSVLDYLKAKLNPFHKEKIVIPPELVAEQSVLEEGEVVMAEADIEKTAPAAAIPVIKAPALPWPWRTATSVIAALLAQSMLEPPARNLEIGLALYLLAAVLAVWAFWQGEWKLARRPEEADEPMRLPAMANWRLFMLGGSVILMLLGFAFFQDNRFTAWNVTLWLSSLTLGIISLLPNVKGTTRQRADQPAEIRVNVWTLLVIAVLAFGALYRFVDLNGIPGEPFSDHAEKLLDVSDVLNGQRPVFFVRNTGREAFQMYLTAFVATFFGTGLSFLSLKLGTALCGFLTLPFIYLTGKEVGNRWVGLLAMLMAGVAYWPNLISRIGLRFPIYPLFAAPMLYFLLRGLRTRKLQDFILSGIFLGVGLHGYSPARFLPFVVLAAIGIYLLHRQSKGNRVQTMMGLYALAFVSLIVFVPLLRYWFDNPDWFSYRAMTRLTDVERAIPMPVWQVFFSNLWKAWVMFWWDNGNIWVHSIPGRPALDAVTGGLYFLGTVLVAARYVRRRHWLDLFLLVSVPLLMMPSILSLAFPEENPSLNRTGAAIVPVFIIAAIGLEGFLRTINVRFKATPLRQWPTFIIGVYLVMLISMQNYSLVFDTFKTQFLNGAWNTSQIGKVVYNFATSIGSYDTAYVIPYPHWVDTRLVGIQAGFPGRDYALPMEQIALTSTDPRPKMFLFRPDDQNTYIELLRVYPNGNLSRYTSGFDGKDFMIYFVPASQ
ncbi:MAG: glycosyltransferase family 39 protein [Anaerolineaceae bacterium]|nr:glycosyltransferase family 39 protein [Anaerolineaceae bacterium]